MAGTAVSWAGLILMTGWLAACDGPVANTIPLAYEPTGLGPAPLSRAVVAMGRVVDARGAPAEWLGTAAGNPGFPEQALVAEPSPASRAVYDAFTTALMARGLLVPQGRPRFDLSVRIVRLDAGEAWTRHAAADLVVTLRRHGSGRIVYTDEVRSAGTNSGPFSLDTVAYVPVADVAELTQRAVNSAIEQALDKPGFRAAVHG